MVKCCLENLVFSLCYAILEEGTFRAKFVFANSMIVNYL